MPLLRAIARYAVASAIWLLSSSISSAFPGWNVRFRSDQITLLQVGATGTGLARCVDAIADKVRTAQVFAEEQSDALDQKNQALKGKLADFLTTAKKTGDDLHDGLNERLSSWIAEIDQSS